MQIYNTLAHLSADIAEYKTDIADVTQKKTAFSFRHFSYIPSMLTIPSTNHTDNENHLHMHFACVVSKSCEQIVCIPTKPVESAKKREKKQQLTPFQLNDLE